MSDAPVREKPNEFHRSMMGGKCAICRWTPSEPGHDPDFASNAMAIHFASEHFEKLPWAFIREIEKRLAEGGLLGKR